MNHHDSHQYRSGRRRVLRWLAAALAASYGGEASAQPWADWRQARPFRCRADFDLAGYEPLFVELQQLQFQLSQRLGVRPAAEPIELYLFRDESSYQSYLASQHPAAPARRALYIKSGGPGEVFAYRSAELDIDLRHETTHALLHAALPRVPLWLDEGLAEYFELPEEERAYGNRHMGGLKWNVRLGLVPRLTSLENKPEVAAMGRREYMFAWGWVHFMLHGPAEAGDELRGYLLDLQNAAPASPLSVRLADRLPSLEKRFSQHFRGWSRG